MADRKNRPDGLTRRDALWMVGTAAPAGLALLMTEHGVGAELLQLGAQRNLRVALADVSRPRTLLTPASINSLRNQLASDSAFRTRWQNAISSFEHPSGDWMTLTPRSRKRLFNSAEGHFTASTAFWRTCSAPESTLV